jgi:polyisoprenoid-binding protein YceI
MGSWKFDDKHSSIGFSVRHMLVSRVRGDFTRWSGELRFDEAAPEQSTLAVRIDAGSIDTREACRDEHLRSSDFLDAARWPHLLYHSRTVERLDAQRFRVVGDLTLRNVTREVPLEVSYGGKMRDPSGVERVGFAARAIVDRKQFGITFNQLLDTGGLALGNKIEIRIDVEAIRSVEADAEGRGFAA